MDVNEARTLTKQAGATVKDVIEEIEKLITDQCERQYSLLEVNGMFCNLVRVNQTSVLNHFRERGFSITEHDPREDGFTWKISWE